MPSVLTVITQQFERNKYCTKLKAAFAVSHVALLKVIIVKKSYAILNPSLRINCVSSYLIITN